MFLYLDNPFVAWQDAQAYRETLNVFTEDVQPG